MADAAQARGVAPYIATLVPGHSTVRRGPAKRAVCISSAFKLQEGQCRAAKRGRTLDTRSRPPVDRDVAEDNGLPIYAILEGQR